MRFIVIAMSNSKHLVQRVSTGGTHFVRYREAVELCSSYFLSSSRSATQNVVALLVGARLLCSSYFLSSTPGAGAYEWLRAGLQAAYSFLGIVIVQQRHDTSNPLR